MSLVFFTDRDLGKKFPELLRAEGIQVEMHADHFAPTASDEGVSGVTDTKLCCGTASRNVHLSCAGLPEDVDSPRLLPNLHRRNAHERAQIDHIDRRLLRPHAFVRHERVAIIRSHGDAMHDAL